MSKFCSMFNSDIVVFSENVDEHNGHLHEVFASLCEEGLKLHPQKCVLGCPQVPYDISAEGSNLDKILAVREFLPQLMSEF